MDSIHIPACLNLEFLNEVWKRMCQSSTASESKKEVYSTVEFKDLLNL